LADPSAVNDLVARLQGKEPGPVHDELRIDDCVESAIATSNARPEVAADYRWNANQFLGWLTENHPRLIYWGQLNHGHVMEFLLEKRQGRRTKSVSALFVPLRLAANYACRIDPALHNWADDLTIPKGTVAPREKVLLDGPALALLLKSVAALSRGAAGWMACCGMAGMLPSEAALLTLGDIDLDAGTIHIRPNAIRSHCKNEEFRPRLLPIPNALIDWLRTLGLDADKRDGSPDSPAFSTASGRTWTESNRKTWWRRNKPKVPCPAGFWVGLFRNSFLTFVADNGASEFAAAAYAGQSSGNKATAVLEKHYRQKTMVQLRTVAAAFDRGFGHGLDTVISA
jgi:integrase